VVVEFENFLPFENVTDGKELGSEDGKVLALNSCDEFLAIFVLTESGDVKHFSKFIIS